MTGSLGYGNKPYHQAFDMHRRAVLMAERDGLHLSHLIPSKTLVPPVSTNQHPVRLGSEMRPPQQLLRALALMLALPELVENATKSPRVSTTRTPNFPIINGIGGPRQILHYPCAFFRSIADLDEAVRVCERAAHIRTDPGVPVGEQTQQSAAIVHHRECDQTDHQAVHQL